MVDPKLVIGLGASLIAAGAALLMPTEASACGGMFCDAFTPDMPVDQTAEGIVFASDGDFVEAHIQIQYDGNDAQQFAWLVPVAEVPEIEVGSFRFVQAALRGTEPIYSYESDYVCDDSGGHGFIQRPDGGGASGEPDVGPDVVARDVVGSFEYAVLQGGSAETINEWLAANDYATDDEAPEILDTYIAEGNVFVAFKLRHGAQIEDIHPIVIRYPGTEPCIPIRLTRIAAKDDMEITAVFLGDSRVVSTNYRHVELNPVRLSWLQPQDGYPSLVSLAVDTPSANGRAFVTEYAGSSNAIDDSTLSTADLDGSVFVDLPVVDVIQALQDQGLATCDADGCTYRHELVPALLHEFVPVPPRVSEEQFYGCLSCYAQLIDQAAWDGTGFAAAYDELIVAPLLHAQELLSTWPYATRLHTRMSPHEMLSDPMFIETEGLPDVPNRHGARQELECCGTIMRLPGGRGVTLAEGWTWPAFDEQMPWAERVVEYGPGGGAPVVLVDNTALIDAQLDAWNAAGPCAEEMGVDDGGTDTTAGDSGEPSDPSSSTGGSASGGAQDESEGAGSGCGCTSGSSGSTPWMLVLGLGLGLGVLRRRDA